MQAFFDKIDPILIRCFRVHDFLSDFLVRSAQPFKRAILLLAHLSLFGFFFPVARKEFGELAGNLLIVILFLSPLSKIFRMRLMILLMGFRRQFGIAFAYFATVHGLGYLLDPAWNQVILASIPGRLFGIETDFLMGIAAYILTLPLLFTSNNWANRHLGKNWKRLHRIVYVVFVFAVFHRTLIRGGSPFEVAQAVFLLLAYGLAKLLAWRNFLPPLRQAITIVAARYQAFRLTVVPPSSPAAPSL